MFDDSLSESSSSADARLVLAAALAQPGLLPALSEVLCAEDFDPDEERPLWLALLALERRGDEIDAQSALRQLARQGNFSALGILPDLEEFVALPPGGAALDKAVANLRRFSQSRQVVALLEELVEIGLKHHGDAPGAFAAIHARAQEALAVRGVGGAKPLSARQLLEEQPACQDGAWLLDRLLPTGGVSLLAGEVASGKTFLALDLAIAVAAGLPAWGGRATSAGAVLYCCLDSSPRTIRARVQALCAGRGIPPPENLFFDFSPLNLAQTAGQERLLAMIRAQKVSLVVIDVLARYLPGLDENSVAAVGPVFTALRVIAARHEVSFLVVHHFNKSGAAGMGRFRGSSDIAAAVDAALSVTVSGSRQQPRRTITPEKNRDLPEEPPFDFSVTVVVVGASGPLAPNLESPAPALRLCFSQPEPPPETARETLDRALDLVLEMLRAHPDGLTRREIEERLAAQWAGEERLSTFALNRLFINLAAVPGVLAFQDGRFKRYRWAGAEFPGRGAAPVNLCE